MLTYAHCPNENLHCPKNNLNLCIIIEPVTIGAYAWFLCQMCQSWTITVASAPAMIQIILGQCVFLNQYTLHKS